jgi:glutamate synthase (NADPH/NADH) small chain
MQKFHQTAQNYPDARDAAVRKADFNEIYQPYAAAAAEIQAERCLQCGVPFCSVHCPLHNNIPDWLREVASGNLQEAYLLSSATNNFPEICGRVCPQDKLCEGNCVVEKGYGSITIGSIEKYITDSAWENGWVEPFAPTYERQKSVGIIGSGPAGMSAAEQLRRAGFQVHIYDRYDRAGGLMMYGIPNFKLEKHIMQRRYEQFVASGVQFHFNFNIGSDISFAEVRAKHDSILIATGVYKARPLNIEGDSLGEVYKALDYLTFSTKDLLNGSDSKLAHGRDVVVIGGGDTAMDCVRTAIRQGARSVRCLYRRTREQMPGSAREVKNAMEEGVVFEWLASPLRLIGENKVTAIEVQKMQLGATGASGRREVEAVKGETRIIPTDMVISALGFEAEDLPIMFNESSLVLHSGGTVKVDSKMMTSLEGVFAAGDIVRGASLVVWAIADGRNVAQNIINFL